MKHLFYKQVLSGTLGAVERGLTMGNSAAKIRFVIIGSGWRALFYVRIALALPEHFELCAMYCRTEEKAARMAESYHIRTTTSVSDCLACKPDFAVVAVTKADIAAVSCQWLEYGIPVLCETPAGLDLPTLTRLWALHEEGAKLSVAEQYTRYPVYAALLALIEKGFIGRTDYAYISLAHGYHGASLMRAFLQIPLSSAFSVIAKSQEFSTVETETRYESIHDGRIAQKKRTTALFQFSGGKTALYDFDSEQYRSPIRQNTLKIQGVKGEITGIPGIAGTLTEALAGVTVRFLDSSWNAVRADIQIDDGSAISFKDNLLYTPDFAPCGLGQDETAISSLLLRMASYARDSGPEPYPLAEALQDAYMAILLQQAADSGQPVQSAFCPWQA